MAPALCISLQAQQLINASITHDGIQRDYILYVPAAYDGSQAVPLVFNFHGLGSNATQQVLYGDFRPIADTANFLIVHPEGTLFSGVQHWNVGGFTTGSTVDDVGFTSALLDTLAAQYNVDLTRVYSTGMSNGGYMSYLLACQLSDRIAAVASVTGSMTTSTFDDCDAQHPTPVMQIHGTADATVPYNGNAFSKSMEEVVLYWADFNNCIQPADTTPLPDINTIDGSTVEHIVFSGGDNGARVEHFKVTGGGHTWPGSFVPLPGTNYDFNASAEIWRFFAEYDLESLGGTVNTQTVAGEMPALRLFPNPTSSQVYLEGELPVNTPWQLFNTQGQLLRSGRLQQPQVDLRGLKAGIYWLKVGERTAKVVKSP